MEYAKRGFRNRNKIKYEISIIPFRKVGLFGKYRANLCSPWNKGKSHLPFIDFLSVPLFLLLFILFIGYLPVAAQSTGKFRTENGLPYIPQYSSHPSATTAGAMYFNTTNNNLYMYNGSGWEVFFQLSSSEAMSTSPDGTDVVDMTTGTGRLWMDRNLGASRRALRFDDYEAYGSMFQWCRAADGHQLISWTDYRNGTAVNGTTSTLSSSTTPGHSLFITTSSSPYDWLSTQLSSGSLWWNGSIAGANNPCPEGYHVPTYAEWNAELTYVSEHNSAIYGALYLTAAGMRDERGRIGSSSSICFYWSSTTNGIGAYYMSYNHLGGSHMNNFSRASGLSVRCIKDQ